MNVIRINCLFTTLSTDHPLYAQVSEYARRYNDVRKNDLAVYIPLNNHARAADKDVMSAVEQARQDLSRYAEMVLGQDACPHLSFEWAWTSANGHGAVAGGWMISGNGTQQLAPA